MIHYKELLEVEKALRSNLLATKKSQSNYDRKLNHFVKLRFAIDNIKQTIEELISKY